MSNIHGYPKVLDISHPALDDMWGGNEVVTVEEKIDGSQMAFRKESNVVYFRSKGAVLHPETSDKLFKPAIEHILSVQDKLEDGTIYRCETLFRPKHNTLVYQRPPLNHLMLFDVEVEPNRFVNSTLKREYADTINVECIPFIGEWYDKPKKDALDLLLELDSVLGGTKVEGIVAKNYARFGKDGKILAGKYVSERFKELHGTDWKRRNPGRGDVVDEIIQDLKTEARWEKSIQHLRDSGMLEGSPRDIGPLLKAIQQDVEEECEELVKERLYQWARKKVLRGVTGGFATFYKDKLMGEAFDG